MPNICPTCGGLAVISCKCFRSDSRCTHGHEWHYCIVHNELVIGASDHKSSKCTCKEEAHG